MSNDFQPQVRFAEQHQQGDHLCWIAVAVSVEHYFDPTSDLRQCQAAKQLLQTPGECCGTPDGVRKTCDQEGRLGDALNHFGRLAAGTIGAPNPHGGGPMPFSELKQQIDGALPVCIFIDWGNGDGHFCVISGYQEIAGSQFVYVNDPLYGTGPRPYNRVVSNYHLAGGKWTWSYRLVA